MSHTSLESYYRMLFALVNNLRYSLTEVEGMPIYERDIFIGFLSEKKDK